MIIATDDILHADHFVQLKSLLDLIQEDRSAEAKPRLQHYWEDNRPFLESTPGTLALFFLNALLNISNQGLSGPAEEVHNLYLLPDQGQQIKMFNFMAQKFPLVRAAQDILNRQYVADTASERHVVFLDIGMGTGQQIVRLIQRLAEEGHFKGTLHIIGIEPSQDSITTAEKAIREAAEQYQISLTFTAFAKTVEQVEPSEWRQIETLISETDGPLLVNASFALHHVIPATTRQAMFERLKQYQPRRLGVIEPYADFLTTDIEQRFQNAWRHYGLTFTAIDGIEATDAQKRDLKAVFFSREIQDVLSAEEQRVEQFETGEMWAEKLIRAGFRLSASQALPESALNFPLAALERYENYYAFTVAGSPIVSILTGQPL